MSRKNFTPTTAPPKKASHPFFLFCKRTGWKHVQLAERLGIQPSSVSRIIGGKSKGLRKTWEAFDDLQAEYPDMAEPKAGQFKSLLAAGPEGIDIQGVAGTINIETCLARARRVLEDRSARAIGLAASINAFFTAAGFEDRE